MPAPVVVEVTAASPDAPALAAMLEACSRAVGHTPCVLARQAPEPPYEAVAIVTLESDGRVRVEVGLQAGEPRPWQSRELVFHDTDLELERWRAVGFVVGTLASAARAEPLETPPEPAPAPPHDEPPPRVAPPPAVTSPAPRAIVTPAARRRVWFGLGWFIGDGLDGVLERNGAYGRAALRPGEFPVFASASLAYGTTTEEQTLLTTSWLDAGLGLGVVAVDNGALSLDLALEAVAERFSAEASDPFSGSSDRDRFIGLVRGRGELAWFWSDYVGASTFGEFAWRGGRTEVSLEGAKVGETGRLGYALGLGLGLRFLQ
jgi:hypothetical protein